MARYLLITARTVNFNLDDLSAHYEHLERLRDEGKVELSGGFSDKSGGAYILIAGSLEEAQTIANADPLIAHGSSTITVKEWLAK